MNKKFLASVMVVLVGMLFLTVGVLTAAEQATKPPQEVLLKYPFGTPKKGPVPFNHEGHVKKGIACTECHHVYENGKNVWKEGMPVQPCDACHKQEKVDNMDKFQNAFHKNCKDCHRQLEKEGKPTGPWKKCNDCHEKKS